MITLWKHHLIILVTSILSLKQIYDLSVDALSPMYYFLLPSSKIRDATFLFNEEGKNVIAIMSSAGYMYTQLMDESSSAQHGPFYVTNVLEITHEDLKVSTKATELCQHDSLITSSQCFAAVFVAKMPNWK